jgi:hypothetical protein
MMWLGVASLPQRFRRRARKGNMTVHDMAFIPKEISVDCSGVKLVTQVGH